MSTSTSKTNFLKVSSDESMIIINKNCIKNIDCLQVSGKNNYIVSIVDTNDKQLWVSTFDKYEDALIIMDKLFSEIA